MAAAQHLATRRVAETAASAAGFVEPDGSPERIDEAVAAMFGPAHAAAPGYPAVRDLLLTSMRGVALADAFDGRTARHARYLAEWGQVARAVLLASS